MNITVVLPAFDEAQNISALITSILKTLSGTPNPYQILVVDDGSRDHTATIVRQFEKSFPVKLLSHSENLGLGRALSTGLRAAMRTPGAVVTMDADSSHDPRYIPEMVQQLSRGSDVVIASRFRPGSRCCGVPWSRMVLSVGASAMLRVFFPFKNVRDYSTGFRAYSSSCLADLFETFGDDFIQEKGFASSVELLLKLRTLKVRAAEIPYVLRYDLKLGASKMRIFRTIARYAVVMSSAAMTFRPGFALKRPAQAISTGLAGTQ